MSDPAEDARDRRAALAFTQAIVYTGMVTAGEWHDRAEMAYRWLQQRDTYGTVPGVPSGGQLDRIEQNQEKIMSALSDLQAADAALKAEVATFLADVATALSADDPDIESVVSDINAQVAALQAADPVTGTAATAAASPAAGVPADSSTDAAPAADAPADDAAPAAG